MQLVIAEKPSVARDIARVLGVRASGESCFKGTNHVITWCIGHLVELDEPASYDPAWRSWRLENLPMLPADFRLRASKHARQQLRAVRDLLRDRGRFRSVVNACDAGREGELIFRYVYQYASSRLPIERLWISSLTDDAIRRGFASLRPGSQLEPLADAARSRSEADWLVGMNATRAITARGRLAGHDALYSIGRVQTPTLAMLVARERAIQSFRPRDYWEVRGDFTTADGARFAAMWRAVPAQPGRLATRELADALVARDRTHAAPLVERVRARTVREAPPLLFDLTSLQRTANRRHGFSAARTLELAQSLYERHKVLTYPRTDSRHLSSDVASELPSLFAALAASPEYGAFAAPLAASPPAPSRRVVDNTKVSDHHAIIPTQRLPSSLDRDEHRIYDLVMRRFLGAFYPDAEFAVTEAWIRVGAGDGAPFAFPDERRAPTQDAAEDRILDALPPPPDRYLARGRVRTVAGWQEVAGIGAASSSSSAASPSSSSAASPSSVRDTDESTALLPPLTEGQRLGGAFAHVAKQTSPPPRFTEATLLGAMESAGKSIDDEALRAAMKDRGLGTPATRASIIETLLRRAYVVRADRQSLVPTPMGIALVDALPVASLASPDLTGTWEARLARIARGEESRASFMADIARYVADTVDAIRGAPPPTAPPPGSTPAQKPAWGRGGRKGKGGGGRRFGGQRRGHDGGTAASPNRDQPRGPEPARGGAARARGQKPRVTAIGDVRASAGEVWTPAEIKRAADAPRDVRTPADIKRASDVPREVRTPAEIKRADGARRVEIDVDVDAAALSCPGCRQGTLMSGSRGWGCTRWREGCRFVVWFETAGRRLTPAQLRDLVTRGKTRKATFEPVLGQRRMGRLVLLPGGTTVVRFQPDDAGVD